MKMIFRIFRINARRSLPCFMSSVLVTATLFLFEGIKEMFLGTMSAEERFGSSLGISARLYIYVLLFIGVILILYTVNNYSRIRLRDYGTFLVLGSGKGTIIRMMLSEYGMISAVSYGAGGILGTGFLFAVRKMIFAEGIAVELSGQMYLGVVFKTFFYMLLIYAAAVLMNVIYLQNHSLSALMRYDRKKSRLPSIKISLIGTVCAAVCFAAAAVILNSEHIPPYIKMKYSLLLVLAGVFLCFTYAGSLLLCLFSSRERWYFKHLLRIKDLYYRFADNKNIMMLSFVINFVVLIFINNNIVEFGCTDSRYLWKYPYDYVYAVEEGKADALLRELGGKHGEELGEKSGSGEGQEKGSAEGGGETGAYPCLFLTCEEYGEYIGIPLSAYNGFTGEEEELEPGKIFGVLQKNEADEDILLPSGRVTLKTGEGIRQFEAARQMNRILFCAYQPESMRVLVFNDEDYGLLRKVWDGSLLITWKMREGIREAQESIRAGYESWETQESARTAPDDSRDTEERMRELADSAGAGFFHSREDLMARDRKEDVMTLFFYIAIGIFLMISNMAVLAVRTWTEIPVLAGKYGFLQKLGMDEGDIKGNVKGELSICMKIPFILSFVLGICALMRLSGGRGYVPDPRVILLFGAVVFVQGCFIAGISSYGYRLVRDSVVGKEENGVRIWS